MAQTAEITGRLRWTLGKLFEVIGAWGLDATAPAISVALATASRHIGWHAHAVAELIPDSVLLDAQQFVGPSSDELADAFTALRSVDGDRERLLVVERVLLGSLDDFVAAIKGLCAPHSDAALIRMLDFLERDLRQDREACELLVAEYISDPDSIRRAGAVASHIEANFVGAGGLIRMP